MFLINTISQEQAKGKIKEVYDIFPGEVPAPFILFSSSPEMLQHQSGLVQYYMRHKSLSFPLLAAIRFIGSDKSGHEYCLDLNRQLLLRAGMNAEEIETMREDPSTAPLENKERIMLVFVAKALRDPKSVSQMDIDALRAGGWTDPDIFDALVHGANMLAGATVFNALRNQAP